jgi:thioredoxin-related protein
MLASIIPKEKQMSLIFVRSACMFVRNLRNNKEARKKKL